MLKFFIWFNPKTSCKRFVAKTWKYIVSVSRARWRRRPAPEIYISYKLHFWILLCRKTCFAIWYRHFWIHFFSKNIYFLKGYLRPSRKPIVIPPRRRSYSSIIPSMLFTFVSSSCDWLHQLLRRTSNHTLYSKFSPFQREKINQCHWPALFLWPSTCPRAAEPLWCTRISGWTQKQ